MERPLRLVPCMALVAVLLCASAAGEASVSAPPPGVECSYDTHCRYPTVCHQSKCVPRYVKDPLALKRKGANLVIAGSTFTALAVAFAAISVAASTGAGDMHDDDVVIFAPITVAMAAIGIPMLAVGAVYIARAKSIMKDQGLLAFSSPGRVFVSLSPTASGPGAMLSLFGSF